jgi:hypothetical protein
MSDLGWRNEPAQIFATTIQLRSSARIPMSPELNPGPGLPVSMDSLIIHERLASAWHRKARMANLMNFVRARVLGLAAICGVILPSSSAEPVPVHHIEGVTFGFLVLRNLDGEAIAYGQLQQVVKEKGGSKSPEETELVEGDLQFHFKDGSFYEEVTKFTQHGKFRLVSDEVEEKGPSFKQPSKSWIDARTGTITVRTTEKGKEKTTTKHLDLPDDVANGLLFILLKNVDPSAAQTTVSYLAAFPRPRIVKWNIVPGPEKTVKFGFITLKAQHYVVKTKIGGAAGMIAPLMGKQPPDLHVWLVKSEAPTFVEYEGPITEDSPVWRIEMIAPEPDARKGQLE